MDVDITLFHWYYVNSFVLYKDEWVKECSLIWLKCYFSNAEYHNFGEHLTGWETVY